MTGKKMTAVLLASGHDARMQSKILKQLLLLTGHTIPRRALQAFSEGGIDETMLVTPQGEAETLYRTYREKYDFRKLVAAVEGGAERCNSVVAGLRALLGRGTELVFIHDTAHPFMSQELLKRMRNAGERYGVAIPAPSVKGTIKLGDAKGFVQDIPPHTLLSVTQTPQALFYTTICAAYEVYDRARKTEDARVLLTTDDARVMERFGACPVKLVEGEKQNQKLITPEDMARVELQLREHGARRLVGREEKRWNGIVFFRK